MADVEAVAAIPGGRGGRVPEVDIEIELSRFPAGQGLIEELSEVVVQIVRRQPDAPASRVVDMNKRALCIP